MIDTVRSLLLRGDAAGVVYECRQCGTTVDSDGSTCPACDSDEIARYRTQ